MRLRDITLAESYDIDELLLGEHCGELLGVGVSRRTFVYEPDPTLVVKIERNFDEDDGDEDDGDDDYEFQYQCETERNLWQRAKDSPGAVWLAPVVWFGRQEVNDRHAVLQRRTQPLDKPPAAVPNFMRFIDCYPDNWGMLDGKPVLHDYGTANPFLPPDFHDMAVIPYRAAFEECPIPTE